MVLLCCLAIYYGNQESKPYVNYPRNYPSTHSVDHLREQERQINKNRAGF